MRRSLLAALVAVVALLAAAPAAPAADSVAIRNVDFRGYPQVKFLAAVAGPTPDQRDFALRENGRIIQDIDAVPIGETNTPVGIVLVIDTSGSMRSAGKLEGAKAAARAFVNSRTSNDQIALVAFSDQPRLLSPFTNETPRLTAVIDALTASGETALFDAVRMSVSLLAERPDLQPNVVVLSDGADTVSQSTRDQALGSVSAAHASVFTVGLISGRAEFDRSSLQQLASASGGQYAETTDPVALSGLYANIRTLLTNQYEVTYTSLAGGGTVEIALAVGGLRTDTGPIDTGASVVQGSSLKPAEVEPSRFADLLKGGPALAAIALVAFLAAGMLVFGVVAIGRRETPPLSSSLSPYGAPAGQGFGAERTTPDLQLVQTLIVRRAVEATARMASGRGVLEALERKLEQADVPVRSAEALFFYLVAVATGGVLGLLLKGPFGAAIAVIVLALVPLALVNYLGERRKRLFAAQLPDMLRLLASSLRAGYSLLQGADAIVAQVGEPMRKELRRVLAEARLGRPLELALEDSARRVRSVDYDWAVMAIKIQREVGGNLAELLQTVADTMVARDRLRREISTLTAESRMSAIVLALLPIVIGFVVYALNPGYLEPLFDRTFGQFMLLSAIGIGILGFLWMRRIIDIDT